MHTYIDQSISISISISIYSYTYIFMYVYSTCRPDSAGRVLCVKGKQRRLVRDFRLLKVRGLGLGLTHGVNE